MAPWRGSTTSLSYNAIGDFKLSSQPSQASRDWVTRTLNAIGEITILFADTLHWLAHSSAWRWSRIIEQLAKIGWGSLPIVSLISFTIGMAVAFQTAYQMQKFSFPSPLYTASFSTLMIFREIGPVLTALLVAGRVGAAMTAEIGTMKITQQIDALRSLATNPVRYLVVPRFLGMIIGLPLLTAYADAIGVFGGYVVGTSQMQIGSQLYIEMASELLALKDLWTGLLKALIFAVIISIVSCYQGFRTTGGAEGVGRSTTWAVVIVFTLIIAADSLITAIFYFLGQ